MAPISGLSLSGDLFKVLKTNDRDARAILRSGAKSRDARQMFGKGSLLVYPHPSPFSPEWAGLPQDGKKRVAAAEKKVEAGGAAP